MVCWAIAELLCSQWELLDRYFIHILYYKANLNKNNHVYEICFFINTYIVIYPDITSFKLKLAIKDAVYIKQLMHACSHFTTITNIEIPKILLKTKNKWFSSHVPCAFCIFEINYETTQNIPQNTWDILHTL